MKSLHQTNPPFFLSFRSAFGSASAAGLTMGLIVHHRPIRIMWKGENFCHIAPSQPPTQREKGRKIWTLIRFNVLYSPYTVLYTHEAKCREGVLLFFLMISPAEFLAIHGVCSVASFFNGYGGERGKSPGNEVVPPPPQVWKSPFELHNDSPYFFCLFKNFFKYLSPTFSGKDLLNFRLSLTR